MCSISHSFQLVLSPYYTVAAQTTPHRYFFQLFLSVTPSYSYQVLLSAACNRYLLLSLTVSPTLYCIRNGNFSYYFQVWLSGNIITYSQLLASAILFRCLYQLLVSNLLAYSYQYSFVTNHYQLQYQILLRSSRSQRFFKIGVLNNFAVLTRKHMCWCLFLIKLHALEPATLLKKDSNIDALVNIAKILRTSFFTEHFWWLILAPIRYPHVI